ncbi:MAG: long-chain fatty acid--CoA ligase [Acidobacteria bacterium]|nr:long-chain fatty acid--CoA ligase [Acidobacteriota bacterium]
MSVFASKPWLKHYDFWVPPVATFPHQSLYLIIQTAASQYRHRPATAYEGSILTFEQIKDRADRLAASLHAKGIRKGDRIGIMLPNCPQYPISFFAAMRLGAIVANINPAYTPRELEAVANDAGIRALVTQKPTTLPFDLVILTPGNFEELIAAGDPAAMPRVTINAEEDVALLQYTGGTTGVSKGAMLTHYNLFANTVQNALWHQYHLRRGEERMLMVLPFFHIYGQVVGMLLSAWNGTMTILIPKFDVNLVIAACREYEPTFFPGVPTLFISLLNHAEAATCGLHKVKHFNSGAAPLPIDVIERFEQLTGVALREGYGMTETSCTASTTPLLARRKIGSIGIPVTSTEFKIVDIDDPTREVGLHEEGELCVRGPQIMKGYWNQPAETANALRDGWMHTGDIARMDEDGFFYIVQRKKDMICVSGFKVFPNEVEDVLFTHPAILEACVVGKPHAYRGEHVKAFVVLRAGFAPSRDDIIAYCAGRLAKFKVPSEIEFISALPKTAVGKVLRRQLREAQ